ncbi:COP9 signalosome complex subunit 5-like [Zophobas morio]|uniref:COP9 signalosome complex subunit 5-like n=1 Tax=Zophobas morio TaxID=2755281 RepID=UPI0030829E5C
MTKFIYSNEATHAFAGGDQEIMGILVGRVKDRSCVVFDSYPLPIIGTETRVTDMSSDPVVGEYMYFLLVTAAEKLNKKEKLIGWYHSHPGFGCWLSKIDCGTQRCCQRGGMHVAVVVDPHRTLADGRLELGAFRCYPQDYRPPGKTETQEKFLKFGSCAEEYYPLEVAYFNTSFQQKILEEVSLGLQSRAVPCLSYDVRKNYLKKMVDDLNNKFAFCDADDKPCTQENELFLEEISCESSRIANEVSSGLADNALRNVLTSAKVNVQEKAAVPTTTWRGLCRGPETR